MSIQPWQCSIRIMLLVLVTTEVVRIILLMQGIYKVIHKLVVFILAVTLLLGLHKDPPDRIRGYFTVTIARLLGIQFKDVTRSMDIPQVIDFIKGKEWLQQCTMNNLITVL